MKTIKYKKKDINLHEMELLIFNELIETIEEKSPLTYEEKIKIYLRFKNDFENFIKTYKGGKI